MIFWGVFAWYLPIINFALTVVALSITGVLFASSPYHIQSVIFVGELGDMLPMKGWFQFFFNIINEITVLIIAIRFYEIYLIRRSTTFTKEVINYFCLFFGICMTVGMLLLTNVQHIVSREVNWSGWIIYIIAGLLYMIGETYLFLSLSESYRFVRILNILRIIFVITFFISAIALFSSLLRWFIVFFPRVIHVMFFRPGRLKDYIGYYNYCIAASMEWILILTLSLFLLTYVYEFWHLDIQQDL